MEYQFIIDGIPVAKGRPRLGRYGTYTPKKTVQYEKLVRACWGASHSNIEPPGTPLWMDVVFHMPIPKGTSKKHQEAMIAGERKHTKRPDVDNLLKAVLDALNGVAYIDDSQIVSLAARKQYGKEAYTKVIIGEIG